MEAQALAMEDLGMEADMEGTELDMEVTELGTDMDTKSMRSFLTTTIMLLLTATQELALIRRSIAMEQEPGRGITLSTFPMAGSSTSTTTPMTMRDMLLR